MVVILKLSATGEKLVIEKCISSGDVVFDVGASVGEWTAEVLSHEKDIECHLFEASPINYSVLKSNLEEGGGHTCTINNIALGRENTFRPFYHYEDRPSWSTFYRRFDVEAQYNIQEPSELCVDVSTLDSYCENNQIGHVALVKIDVEGAEYDVLIGASEMLRRGSIDYIQFEYGGTYKDACINLRMVLSLLWQHRYEIYKVLPDDIVYVGEFSDDLEDYSYCNYLAVNERLKSRFIDAPPAMLDLSAMCMKYHIVPRGVIHIGAFDGKEFLKYESMGIKNVIFIEANPLLAEGLSNKFIDNENVQVFSCAISDSNGVSRFYVTSSDQSSSLLKLNKHKEIYPGIVETCDFDVETKTLEALCIENNIDLTLYNILNIDIQGAELRAFMGAGRILDNIDLINTEVNYEELYFGCALIGELDEFLEQRGFTRKETTTPYHSSWGDALYIRKPVITMTSLSTNGRFANQLFQYMFLKVYAKRFGLRVQVPDWVGRKLFGLVDDYPDDVDRNEIAQQSHSLLDCEIVNSKEVLGNVNFWGYFQYNTIYYASEKEYIRSLFTPVDFVNLPLREGVEKILKGGRSLVGIHVRRGDYGYKHFFQTPVSWYKRWLNEVWPQLKKPVLYIASDEIDSVIDDFSEFNPISAKDLGVTLDNHYDYFTDFFVLTKCHYLAISNSSFSFMASMLNESKGSFVRPNLKLGYLVSYNPWESEPILRDEMAEDHGEQFMLGKETEEKK